MASIKKATSGRGSSGDLVNCQPVPPCKQGDEGGKPHAGNGHGKDDPETIHVSIEDNGQLIGREGLAEVGGARQDKGDTVDVGADAHYGFEHLVEEGGLGTGDEECAAETLEDCARDCQLHGPPVKEGVGVLCLCVYVGACVDLQRIMPVADERSADETVPCMTIMGIWKPRPAPTPKTIW